MKHTQPMGLKAESAYDRGILSIGTDHCSLSIHVALGLLANRWVASEAVKKKSPSSCLTTKHLPLTLDKDKESHA